jgi:hypothetical protein
MSGHFTMPSATVGSTTNNPFFEPNYNPWGKKNPTYNKTYKTGRTTVGGMVARPNIVFTKPK